MNTQAKTSITNVQMEQVKGIVRDHLEKHKFFDSLKSAVAKDPKLNKLDRNQIIDKLKSEGVLNEIISQLPLNKKPTAVSTANLPNQVKEATKIVASKRK